MAHFDIAVWIEAKKLGPDLFYKEGSAYGENHDAASDKFCRKLGFKSREAALEAGCRISVARRPNRR